MSRNSFVWYQVSEELNPELKELNLLSLSSTFEQVDLPLWKEKQRHLKRNGMEILIRQVATTTNISDYFRQEQVISFVTPEKRGKLFSFLKPSQNQHLLVNKFEGRHLLLHEVINELQVDRNEHTILNTLQRLYLQGVFDWTSSIDFRLYCKRCGYGKSSEGSWWKKWLENLNEQNLIQVECATCGKKDCYYCPQCLHLGMSKSCEPFLAWHPTRDVSEVVHREWQDDHLESLEQGENRRGDSTVSFSWNGQLSRAQQHASDQLSQFVHGRPIEQDEYVINSENQSNHLKSSDHELKQPRAQTEYLIYAVCGAGKTEILFQTIYQSLCKKHKVLITSPRRDVIVELAPRLKEAFPQTEVCVLHGESNEKYQAGDLFLATTHQTLRFQQYFDLVVIDEEDAFPYHFDPMLPYVVQRARKVQGHVVYLTATPRDAMLRRVEKGELQAVRILQRFHGYPLAIPKIQVIGRWRLLMENKEVISEIVQYITHLLHNQRYGYLFVPYVKDLPLVKEYVEQTIIPYITKQHPRTQDSFDVEKPIGRDTSFGAYSIINIKSSFVVETVHSEDPQRMEIVQEYRAHKIHLLITTTILERGVTISHSDVGILGSDDQTFDVASLIQMSGRAGRKAADPVGNVWFFPEVRTNTQLKAIRTIKECNQLASGEGNK